MNCTAPGPTATMIALTADEIRELARTYNAEYPQAMPLIDSGEPELLVTVLAADRMERTFRVVVDAGVRACDEGREVWIGSMDPVVVVSGRRPRWGNVSWLVNAQRLYGWSVRGALVPVRWVHR
jgi:hypothetical protein